MPVRLCVCVCVRACVCEGHEGTEGVPAPVLYKPTWLQWNHPVLIPRFSPPPFSPFCSAEDIDEVRRLLNETPADPLATKDGTTIIEYAVQTGNVGIVKLLDLKANPGANPLFVRARAFVCVCVCVCQWILGVIPACG